MTLNDTLTQLKALGHEKMRAQHTRNGAGDNQFGVALGDIRVLAKKLHGARFRRGVADTDWGTREFRILDHDGHTLCFGQRLSGAG